MKFTKFITAMFLSSLSGQAAAQGLDAVTVPVALVQRPDKQINRQITLAELGLNTGVSFSRLAGQAEIFFPMPNATAFKSATLVLDFVNEATLKNERFLHVKINGRVVRAFDLKELPRSGRLEVPVNSAWVQGDFVEVKLEYSGGATEHYCLDERASGDFFEIAETSYIALEVDPTYLGAVEDIAALQPQQTRVSLPEGLLEPAALSAALKAATQYSAEMGHVTFGNRSGNIGSTWTEAHIALNAAEGSTQFASSLKANSTYDWPVIEVSGGNPQKSIEVLNSASLRALANTSGFRTNGINIAATDVSKVSFEQMEFDLGPRNAAGTARFDFTFDISTLPKGTRPESVALLVAAAGSTDDSHGDLTVVAFMNDALIGSGVLRDAQPEWFEFDIPKGLETRNNLLRVQVMRQAKGGECVFAPTAYPAQILPSSHFKLETRSKKIDDFFLLRQEMRDGVDVVADPTLMAVSASDFLNMVAPTVAGILPETAKINVTAALDASGSDPFIYISETPPAGSDPRLIFTDGVVELRNANGELMFSAEDLGRFSTAQIVKVAARNGLWLRPGYGPSPKPTTRQPLILDLGDVALIDEEGVALATSTTRSSLVQIEYPEQRDLLKILEQYRPWIILGIWLFVTLVVVRILRAMHLGRKAKEES